MSSRSRADMAHRSADRRGARPVAGNVYPIRGGGHPRFTGSAPIRLTRRGRLVIVVCAASLLLAGLWITTQAVGLAATRGGDPAHPTVTVGRADTLWGIAVRNRPNVDPRVTIVKLYQVNDLHSPVLQPGKRLRLP